MKVLSSDFFLKKNRFINEILIEQQTDKNRSKTFYDLLIHLILCSKIKKKIYKREWKRKSIAFMRNILKWKKNYKLKSKFFWNFLYITFNK